MKTLYITRGNNILVDAENNTANRIDTSRQGIDSVYIAREPMHVVFGVGEYSREFDVDVNDIIITFYPKEYKYQAIAIKNSEWLENILEYEKEIQKEKERWAASKCDNKTESIAA